MKFILLSLFVVSLPVLAVSYPFYPVDKEIEGLRAKANYLEQLKNILERNTCFIELGRTKVHLAPGALRSEGLVIAIGDGFANQYLAYHTAPKPEALEKVINMTFLKPNIGKGANIVTTRLVTDEKTQKVEKIVVIVNEPYQEPTSPELWLYEKTAVALPLSLEEKLSGEVKHSTEKTKRPFLVRCN